MIPTFISYEEQDELGSALVNSRESEAEKKRSYVDIIALAKSFGLAVRYDSFAEHDTTRDGFLSDGIDPLKVWRSGKRTDKVFPEGTIVIDRSLKEPGMENRLRYTIAHEVAHHINSVHQSSGCFHSEFDSQRAYSNVELRKVLSINEMQANSLAGILLTPSHKLKKVFREVTGGKMLIQYGDRIIDADTRAEIAEMASMMKVSFSVMRIRLERLGLFERLPIDRYVEDERFNLDGKREVILPE